MPTVTGKETATEKSQRVNRENYAAMRGAITDEIRETAQADASTVAQGGVLAEYGAGDRLTLRAGARRTYEADEGKLRAIALHDALESAGVPCIGYSQTFGIGAGRSGVRYSVITQDYDIRQRGKG